MMVWSSAGQVLQMRHQQHLYLLGKPREHTFGFTVLKIYLLNRSQEQYPQHNMQERAPRFCPRHGNLGTN